MLVVDANDVVGHILFERIELLGEELSPKGRAIVAYGITSGSTRRTQRADVSVAQVASNLDGGLRYRQQSQAEHGDVDIELGADLYGKCVKRHRVRRVRRFSGTEEEWFREKAVAS